MNLYFSIILQFNLRYQKVKKLLIIKLQLSLEINLRELTVFLSVRVFLKLI